MRGWVLAMIAASLSLVLFAAPAFAQLLNPGFERGSEPSGSIKLVQGSQAIESWTVTGDAVFYAGTDWASAEGARSVGLYTGSPASRSAISQRIPTIPGAIYVLIIAFAPAPLNGPCIHRELTVRAAGQTGTFATVGVGTATDPAWRDGSWTFTAIADSTTLELANDYDSRNCGILVDRVRVDTPLPVRRTSWGTLRRRYQR